MFNEKIKTEFPTPTHFFECAIKNSKLAHAYMLEGNDLFAQYYFTLQVAKVLNCQNNEFNENCTCTNCSWINQNKHPEVITISPIDYKQGDTASVINIAQARKLKEDLSTSSRYYRVIIFTDAVEGKEHAAKFEEQISEYKNLISMPNDEENDRIWLPKPLNAKVFRPDSANTLLKIIEEPHNRILFFFLTSNRHDMLDTIVSRCQIIPVISKKIIRAKYDMLEEITKNFPFENIENAMFYSEKFVELTKNHDFMPEDLLASLQEYINQLLQTNIDNKFNSYKLIEFLKEIEKTAQALKFNVNFQSAIENLFTKSLCVFK
ncbi:MAG: hypothetical protein PHV68_05800 [Candidatus Gastranaerophilales bacterium]|nr:hypothetical protein [Candidatus Gastranaerophilales bacterium]